MNEMIERVARALARGHFMRKRHYGACTQEDRVRHMVETNWRNHVSDAIASIKVIETMVAANETIERVAKVFADANLDGCETTDLGGDIRACVGKCHCRETARAATAVIISALTAPTPSSS